MSNAVTKRTKVRIVLVLDLNLESLLKWMEGGAAISLPNICLQDAPTWALMLRHRTEVTP
jgi:hypothetical protein